tara:strand:+ start:380053 stop:380757 length:705 start_codon:yes stop_codon:yes gene_type:complete
MAGFITMMINKRYVVMSFISLCLLNIGTVAAKCDFDDFPVMDEMALQSVMDDANYNNRPMMVQNFIADDVSYHDVVDYYHKIWDKRYDDTAFGMWHQISTMTNECMMTVQVAAQNNSTPSVGRLVISNPPTSKEGDSVGEDVLTPPDSVVVSDLTTDDGPKKGRITMLSTAGSTSDVAGFYRNEMQHKGWTLDREFNEAESRVLVFRKGLNVSNILIIPAGEMTQVLINEEIIK